MRACRSCIWGRVVVRGGWGCCAGRSWYSAQFLRYKLSTRRLTPLRAALINCSCHSSPARSLSSSRIPRGRPRESSSKGNRWNITYVCPRTFRAARLNCQRQSGGLRLRHDSLSACCFPATLDTAHNAIRILDFKVTHKKNDRLYDIVRFECN